LAAQKSAFWVPVAPPPPRISARARASARRTSRPPTTICTGRALIWTWTGVRGDDPLGRNRHHHPPDRSWRAGYPPAAPHLPETSLILPKHVLSLSRTCNWAKPSRPAGQPGTGCGSADPRAAASVINAMRLLNRACLHWLNPTVYGRIVHRDTSKLPVAASRAARSYPLWESIDLDVRRS
jgi:hypothetical protein